MSFTKGIAVVGFPFAMVNKATGDPVTTGVVTGYVTKDGEIQTAMAGIPVHEGNGQWSVDITADEMDADLIGLLFVHPSGINEAFTIKTAAPVVEPDPSVPTEIDLIASALAPRKTVTDEGSVEERSMDELIKADRYVKGQEASGVPWGIRVARIKPRGTV